jgi:pimeloyl-ACP methyl ester carboxylesterase
VLAGYQALTDDWAANGFSETIAGTLEQTILGTGWNGAPAWRAKWAKFTPGNLSQCMRTLAERDDISGRLKEISAPTLVICGHMDRAMPPDKGRLLAEGIPNSRLVEVDGAHAPNLTHPAPVNAAMLASHDQLQS